MFTKVAFLNGPTKHASQCTHRELDYLARVWGWGVGTLSAFCIRGVCINKTWMGLILLGTG